MAEPRDRFGVPLPRVPEGTALDREVDLKLLLVIWGVADAEIEPLLDSLVEWQRIRQDFKPIIVTDSRRAQAFTRRGFLYEHVPDRAAWVELAGVAPEGWLPYLRGRLGSIVELYRPDLITFAGDGSFPNGIADGLLDVVRVPPSSDSSVLLRPIRTAMRSPTREDRLVLRSRLRELRLRLENGGVREAVRWAVARSSVRSRLVVSRRSRRRS